MNHRIMVLLIVLSILLSPAYGWALPAFPGAEGMGASSIGGRGGRVIKVTNLNNSGTGSLRDAVEASGPRIVVFTVSGIINLESILRIENPYITIAGQTSPGGILVAGQPTRILTHDVIMTHMRFRKGSHGCSGESCATMGETLYVGNGYNVIIDHCSFSWGTDEAVQVGSYWGDAYDVTFSWCTIHEGLNDPHPEDEHGFGFLISHKYARDTGPRVSIHHTYLAHHANRVPRVVGDVFLDFRNNVVYNWYKTFTPRTIYSGGHMPRVNWVHNYTKPGVDSRACYPEGTSGEMQHCGTGSSCSVGSETPEPALYVAGNLGCIRDDQEDDEWSVVEGWTGNLLSTDWRAPSPHPTTDIPVTTTTMSYAYAQEILRTVGATKPVRDSVDARIVEEFNSGTGSLMADVSYPSDFPVFQSPAAPADTDNDGMADSWEQTVFGSLSQTANGDPDGDGYTNIESYLHFLGGYSEGSSPNPAPEAPGNLRTISQ